MSIISLIFTVVTNIPEIISLGSSLISLIHAIHGTNSTQGFVQLKQAVDLVHASGDPSQLHSMADALARKPMNVSGVGDPSDLVK